MLASSSNYPELAKEKLQQTIDKLEESVASIDNLHDIFDAIPTSSSLQVHKILFTVDFFVDHSKTFPINLPNATYLLEDVLVALGDYMYFDFNQYNNVRLYNSEDIGVSLNKSLSIYDLGLKNDQCIHLLAKFDDTDFVEEKEYDYAHGCMESVDVSIIVLKNTRCYRLRVKAISTIKDLREIWTQLVQEKNDRDYGLYPVFYVGSIPEKTKTFDFDHVEDGKTYFVKHESQVEPYIEKFHWLHKTFKIAYEEM